jgi:quercetin dioxygenase-like cupin family protein
MARDAIRPYALKAGDGWTYNYGIDFTVKAGELGHGRRLAFVEYATRSGEEPPDHTHGTEDEIFYVLQGALTSRSAAETTRSNSKTAASSSCHAASSTGTRFAAMATSGC